MNELGGAESLEVDIPNYNISIATYQFNKNVAQCREKMTNMSDGGAAIDNCLNMHNIYIFVYNIVSII
jgi:hypothetical protein